MMIRPEIEAYAEGSTTPFGADMDALDAAARAELPFAEMLSGPVVGRLLETLVWITGARHVLELGTYAGYSAAAMAAALPADGELVSCELDAERADWARAHIVGLPGTERVRIEAGPALETIAREAGPWDLVFIDADKDGYPGYVEAVLPRLAPRGVIVLDNMLRGGRVLEDDDEAGRAMAALNTRLASDRGLVTTLLTVRDGVTLVRRA